MLIMDFMFERYRKLCAAIRDSGVYQAVTVVEYLKKPRSNSVLLRHDVDRKPRKALVMAQIETDYGLRSTYYIRAIQSCFDKNVLKALVDLGHEVGYHYETLSRAKGNVDKALRLFQEDLDKFRSVVPVQTVCMHGSPFSRWNNLNIWHKARLEDFGLLGDPYISIDFREIEYFSDTGRTWHSTRFNIKDRVHIGGIETKREEIETTHQLISIIKARHYENLMILSHPNRWAANLPEWIYLAVSDVIINYTKMIVKLSQGNRSLI